MQMLEDDHGRPVPAELRATIQRDAVAAFPERLQAVVGRPELLASLTMPRCVASSSDVDRVELSLNVTGLAPHFDPAHVFSAQMVTRGKPSPDLFLHAAARVGVDPSRCLVVEDSPHGVTTAIAAGMAR
jgi:HAD superfamily hydrolase (TIGR01509 family)